MIKFNLFHFTIGKLQLVSSNSNNLLYIVERVKRTAASATKYRSLDYQSGHYWYQVTDLYSYIFCMQSLTHCRLLADDFAGLLKFVWMTSVFESHVNKLFSMSNQF